MLNIFRNFIPNKDIKLGYKYPNWMNPAIISSLRNRSKLAKKYYSNPTEENENLLNATSKECSNMIVKAKERYTNKLSKKLDETSTMPQAYWSILTWITKKIRVSVNLKCTVKLLLISRKKWNSSIRTLPLSVLKLTTEVYVRHISIKQISGWRL